MTPPHRAPAPELPMDLVDAVGVLGAFAGVLSAGEPFFLGLTVVLEVLLVATALLRRVTDPGTAGDPARRRRYLLGFALVFGAGAFAAVHPAGSERFLGILLGTSGLPLWSIARRPRPFGGE